MKDCIKCGVSRETERFLKKENVCLACDRKRSREYYKKRKNNPEYQEKLKKTQKDWWEKNREWGNERQRKYRENNTNFQLSNALRARVKYALLGCVRQDKTFDLLGCTPNEWKAYLEAKFKDGMSWENYGSVWEVDHIIPVSHFDLTNREEQKKAFHYTNTQPLCSKLNKQKGNRWVG